MARKDAKRAMGIWNDNKNTNGGDTISTSMRERNSYPS